MKRIVYYLQPGLLALSLTLSMASFGFGQQPKPQPTPPKTAPPTTPDQGQEKEIVNIRRVRLPITVTDKKGQFVSGLTAKDFLIFEDKMPQQIDSFTSEENNSLPLYVAVLMDTSPSTAGKLKFEQESAMNFGSARDNPINQGRLVRELEVSPNIIKRINVNIGC